ncbi:MAG: lytic transglycosylase domain-containing protein [Gammaproteobacteria bacterium]|nr:lytic transglycosylase domain-containing protein [Gammaproteobacteria bacterium]
MDHKKIFWTGLTAWACAIVAVSILASTLYFNSAYASPCPIEWDSTFQSATSIFMPQKLKSEWKLVKSSALTESGCKADVCSNAHACGVLQILQGTWNDLRLKEKRVIIHHLPPEITDKATKGSIFDAKLNIFYGTKYLGWLASQWLGRDRSPVEVFKLAAAAYNAGIGNILKAQAACGGARLWEDIKPCLHKITGHRAKETIDYIDKIFQWREKL